MYFCIKIVARRASCPLCGISGSKLVKLFVDGPPEGQPVEAATYDANGGDHVRTEFVEILESNLDHSNQNFWLFRLFRPFLIV